MYLNKCNLLNFVFVFILGSLSAQEEEFPDLLADTPEEETIPRALLAEEVIIEEGTNSRSVDGAFVVISNDFKYRTDIIKIAENLRLEFFKLLGKKAEEKNGKTPIHIFLLDVPKEQAVGKPYRMKYGVSSEAGVGNFVKLYVDKNRISPMDLTECILKALFIEHTVTNYQHIPDDISLVTHQWVLDGYLTYLDWRAGTFDRQVFLDLSQNPKLFELEKIWDLDETEIRNLDLVGRNAYRAACGALLMSLTNQPNGKESMQEMLAEISVFQGDAKSIIRRYFPRVNQGKNGIRVAWLLELTLMGTPKMTDTLDILETEKQLESILNFQWENEEGDLVEIGIEGFELVAVLPTEKRELVVKEVLPKIYKLENRCFPLYRPMLLAYNRSLNLLLKTPEKGLLKKKKRKAQISQSINILKNISKERELYLRAASRARDFMDWYAIHDSKRISYDFSSKEEKEELNNVSGANSPLKEYLDKLDSLYD